MIRRDKGICQDAKKKHAWEKPDFENAASLFFILKNKREGGKEREEG